VQWHRVSPVDELLPHISTLALQAARRSDLDAARYMLERALSAIAAYVRG